MNIKEKNKMNRLRVSIKKEETSPLCQQCTGFKKCLAETSGKPFQQELMRKKTYCSRFDNKDKAPRLFPFLQPYEVDVFNAVDWYRNHVWHPASEEPTDKAQCLVITKRKSKDIVTYSNQFFHKGHVVADPCKLYALSDVILWADTEVLLPDNITNI